MKTFLHKKLGDFPPKICVHCLMTKASRKAGMVVLGDTMLSFLPETGLDVNSGFGDVVYLGRAPDIVSEDSCLHEFLAEYETLN